MTPEERWLLEKLDRVILTASDEDLKKIQEFDIQTQLTGKSFCYQIIDSRHIQDVPLNKLLKSSDK
ncbi:MAG: hypothetical protein KC483_04700 [Nitrosarchaeum sp.]|nr:hypothetical protein [Nitrosarchaeum sp.]